MNDPYKDRPAEKSSPIEKVQPMADLNFKINRLNRYNQRKYRNFLTSFSDLKYFNLSVSLGINNHSGDCDSYDNYVFYAHRLNGKRIESL